jgi:hypothetical protein
MEITYIYRPIAKTLVVWNTIDDILSDDERASIVAVHELGADDDWNFRVSTYNGHFHSLTALNIHEEAQMWNLWLSNYLPDEVVANISQMVAQWDLEYLAMTDQREQILTRHKVTLNC